MIQFKRGSTPSWKKNRTPLAAGQPGYDKDKHKLKIGDGKTSWINLPYASGLAAEEILDSEANAKKRYNLDHDDKTIITYGTANPNKNTIGRLYLQSYESEPETDYVVEHGVNGIWSYRKWHSGRAECCGTVQITATVETELGAVYSDNKAMETKSYPFKFVVDERLKLAPSEVATVHGPTGILWLAVREENTNKHSAAYSIISPNKQHTPAKYIITIRAEGYWR